MLSVVAKKKKKKKAGVRNGQKRSDFRPSFSQILEKKMYLTNEPSILETVTIYTKCCSVKGSRLLLSHNHYRKSNRLIPAVSNSEVRRREPVFVGFSKPNMYGANQFLHFK